MKKLIFVIMITICWCMILSAQTGTTVAQQPTNFAEPGAGTEANPYLIGTLGNLRWLSENSTDWWMGESTPVHFKQIANIDATETTLWNDGVGFYPIGHPEKSTMTNFIGVYDGSNFAISDLFSDHSQHQLGINQYAGVFYSTSSGTIIKNVHLANIDFSGFVVGGIVSVANNTTIQNCSVSGNLNRGGGIAQRIEDSIITNCSFIGSIGYGAASSAGLVTSANGFSEISNSFFKGNTSGSQYGGLVANLRPDAVIENSYVVCTFNNGSYNAGLIYNIEGTATGNFWNIETSNINQAFYMGSGTSTNNFGLTTAEMKQASTYIDNGWDFDTIWAIHPDINDGYPYLRSHNTEVINPTFSVSPSSKNFGVHFMNELSDSQTFTISNSGDGELTIQSIVLSGDYSGQFLLTNTNSLPVNLSSNQSIQVSIVYAPTIIGMRSADLIITDNLGRHAYAIPLVGEAIVLNPPTNIQHGVDIQTVTFTWDAAINISQNNELYGYKVYRDGVILTDPYITTLTFTDANLPNGTYLYSLSTLYEYGESESIDIEVIVNFDPDSFPPQNLTFELHNYTVNLFWEEPANIDPTNPFIGYKIYRDGIAITEFVLDTLYYDSNIINSTIYTYHVTAVYLHGESEPSNDEIVNVVFIPDNLRHSVEQNTVILTWDRPRDIEDFSNDGLIGYHVYRDNVALIEIPHVAEYYTDTLLISGEYTYSVLAEYAIGKSETISIEIQFTVSDTDEVTPINITTLKGNYPNPFNPETTINFALSNPGHVRIDIFNIRGSFVKTLVNADMLQGEHTVVWNGLDNSGHQVSSGVYFYQMKTNDYSSIKRMVLMK